MVNLSRLRAQNFTTFLPNIVIQYQTEWKWLQTKVESPASQKSRLEEHLSLTTNLFLQVSIILQINSGVTFCVCLLGMGGGGGVGDGISGK